jgi:hypothetical protein
VSLHLGHRHGTRPRVYCPACGEVRGSEQYTKGQAPTVYGHHRNDGGPDRVLCPGGPIDPVKDKAT